MILIITKFMLATQIITVRNPFDRLVSAYREKMMPSKSVHASKYYHVQVAKQVQTVGMKYRYGNNDLHYQEYVVTQNLDLFPPSTLGY